MENEENLKTKTTDINSVNKTSQTSNRSLITMTMVCFGMVEQVNS